jgi:hypothetical protein
MTRLDRAWLLLLVVCAALEGWSRLADIPWDAYDTACLVFFVIAGARIVLRIAEARSREAEKPAPPCADLRSAILARWPDDLSDEECDDISEMFN